MNWWSVCSAGKQITIRHTHAHKGQPWNELADSLAKAAALDVMLLIPDRKWLDVVPSPGDAWAWTQYLDVRWPSQYPAQQNGRFIVTPECVPYESVNIVTYKQVVTKPVVAESLALVSYNPCTLGSDDEEGSRSFWLEKSPFIASQLEQYHLVGIQEARTAQGDSILIGEQSVWYRIASGRGLSGSGASILGVELWVNLSIPFAYVNEKPAYFKQCDATISYKDPRLLLVRIVNQHIDIFVAVGHAPHSGASAKDRAAF